MRIVLIVAAIVVAVGTYSFADAPATQPAPAAFEKMKTLAGDWKGKGSKGDESNVSYKLAANGSALMETLEMHGNMVTIYTLDNDRVLMTHYCAAQNQPRMVVKALDDDGKTLAFKFLDATGMKKGDGHMHALKITFVDDDHIKQEWTFNEGGEDKFTETISLERVKK